MKSFVVKCLSFVVKQWIFLFFALFCIFLYLFIFKIDANVKVGVLALFGSVCVAYLTHSKNKEREIASRLFPEKKAAYDEIFTLIFEIMFNIKYPQEKDEKEEMKKILELKKRLMIWGSGEAITCFNRLGVSGDSGLVLEYENLVKILRKDLGHDDSSLEPGQLLGLILIPEDKSKLINSQR